MENIQELQRRIASLEALVAEQAATIRELRQRNAELEARNAELELELRRRGKNYRPKGNTPKRTPPAMDRRRKPQRKHPGSNRPNPPDAADAIHHDVHLDHCPCCGAAELELTGQFDDRFVVDLPEPKPQTHRYRRHIYRCRHCQREVKGRADLDAPGSTVGPRARLLTVYCRAYLGISLGKTVTMLSDLFGLSLSRAGALGHLRWFDRQFDPVVSELLELLKNSAVVHADETGWRIDGKNVWCWLFANPRIAVFLIDHHRSRAVIEEALGASLPGVLVTDFYAAYHKIDCKKQRCLVHLLRELAKLREELSPRLVAQHIQPLIELFQDAMALASDRAKLSAEEFAQQAARIRQRFAERWWRRSSDADCQRIYNRLKRHKDELLVFLDRPEVSPDNNAAERDIRSVAATRADGGVNRTDWGAKAFATAKTIVRTCQKAGLNFFKYSLDALNSIQAGQPAPLPVNDTS